MALSRTARILIAILLLAAAAFFWVNFFYQSRLAEVPVQDPVIAATTPAVADAHLDARVGEGEPTDAQVGEGEPTDAQASATEPVDAEVRDSEPVDADAGEPRPTDAQAGAPEPTDAPSGAATDPTAPADAGDTIVVGDEPPIVAIDVPITVTREVVIADLPFLVTSPRPQEALDATPADEAERPGPVTVPGRATINPFSPVVVRIPPAPTREVPSAVAAAGSTPVAGSAPTVAPAVVTRAPAPTPRPLAPAAPTASALTRELPTGSVLSSTPDLLRQPRVGTVAERVDLPSVTTIALPAAEPAVVAAPPTPRTPIDEINMDPVRVLGMPVVPDGVTVEFRPTGPDDARAAEVEATAEDGAPAEPAIAGAPVAVASGARTNGVSSAPLPAGTTLLSRYLRDNNYVFTGSVMGPVSVGVFRSQLETTPVVVALGQTLPNTEIVLTDLRGMQAELTLDDSSQILSLDLRR